jgi:hypothetical protein
MTDEKKKIDLEMVSYTIMLLTFAMTGGFILGCVPKNDIIFGYLLGLMLMSIIWYKCEGVKND